MELVKFENNSSIDDGFYLVKCFDYTESGYCVAEYVSTGSFWICDVNGKEITDCVTHYSKDKIE